MQIMQKLDTFDEHLDQIKVALLFRFFSKISFVMEHKTWKNTTTFIQL